MFYKDGSFVHGDDVYLDDGHLDEVWAYIAGYPGYMVSNKARVWSEKTHQFLAMKKMDDHGHLGVCLYRDGRRHYEYIHRLVARAFISNPHEYPIVRHVYDEPELNEPEDLAWGTRQDNAQDALLNGRAYIPTDMDRYLGNRDRMMPIIATNIATGERLYFDSQGEASRVLRIPQSNIWKVLNGQRCTAGGYTFEEDAYE